MHLCFPDGLGSNPQSGILFVAFCHFFFLVVFLACSIEGGKGSRMASFLNFNSKIRLLQRLNLL